MGTRTCDCSEGDAVADVEQLKMKRAHGGMVQKMVQNIYLAIQIA